jgi:hypothetical protein
VETNAAEPVYWLDLFSDKTWREFLSAGATVSGFREGRRPWVKRIKPGDYLLCYLVGVSRFIGLLEVKSEPFEDDEPIWSAEAFPLRVKVEKIIGLTPETGVPAKDLLTRFTFWNQDRPRFWEGKVQGSPNRWETRDGELIVEAMRAADRDPVVRPFKATLLTRATRKGTHQAPRIQDDAAEPEAFADASDAALSEGVIDEEGKPKEVRLHSRMEYLLLRLGGSMGLQLWIDPSDRNQLVDGTRLGDVPGVIDDALPQFRSDLAYAVKRIDVLWLRDDEVIAAFEVESTTAVYSGLLRMADLLALQPNLNISLFIVAEERRRKDVVREISRPTFSRALRKPLAKSCRYISFERLQERASAVLSMGLGSALRPEDFLDTISEVAE